MPVRSVLAWGMRSTPGVVRLKASLPANLSAHLSPEDQKSVTGKSTRLVRVWHAARLGIYQGISIILLTQSRALTGFPS